ncbi:MAG: hypothetical protein K8S98_15610 [Planctomycetes bacterium]|nr:hypothetical protein [Planctomycetota bacterium]
MLQLNGSRSSFLGAFVAASLCLAASVQAQAQQYTLTNLGGTRPGDTFDVALSNTGFATGWTVTNVGPLPNLGFVWSPKKSMTPNPPVGQPWTSFNGVDVNDSGTVVGLFGTASFMSQGYRWTSGAAEEIHGPLGFQGIPRAINSAGWIVGVGGGPGSGLRAIMWDPSLAPSFVADLTSASGINASNQVVGWRSDAAGTLRGFLWENGVLTSLGSLDPLNKGNVLPRAINDGGRVVGASVIGGHEHAFLWTAASGMTELTGLGVAGFPFNVSANDINSSGWILGYAPNAQGQADVLWGPDGSIRELAPLIPDIGPGKTWSQFFGAHSLNDAGQIGAVAITSALPPAVLGPQLRPILLTPANLTASALTPGTAGSVNTLQVSGATPGALAILAADADDPLDRGYATIEGCGSMGLAMKAPRVVASAPVDATGHATLTWKVPSSLTGVSMRVQVFQKSECFVSNVVRVSF